MGKTPKGSSQNKIEGLKILDDCIGIRFEGNKIFWACFPRSIQVKNNR